MKHLKLITRKPYLAQLQDLPTSQALTILVALIGIVESFMVEKGTLLAENPTLKSGPEDPPST